MNRLKLLYSLNVFTSSFLSLSNISCRPVSFRSSRHLFSSFFFIRIISQEWNTYTSVNGASSTHPVNLSMNDSTIGKSKPCSCSPFFSASVAVLPPQAQSSELFLGFFCREVYTKLVDIRIFLDSCTQQASCSQ